jgi:hypothetical protein
MVENGLGYAAYATSSISSEVASDAPLSKNKFAFKELFLHFLKVELQWREEGREEKCNPEYEYKCHVSPAEGTVTFTPGDESEDRKVNEEDST